MLLLRTSLALVEELVEKFFFNAQPDFRLFLNEYVRKAFNLHDHIPLWLPRYGRTGTLAADRPFLHEREYDFVYTGDLSPVRQPGRC